MASTSSSAHRVLARTAWAAMLVAATVPAWANGGMVRAPSNAMLSVASTLPHAEDARPRSRDRYRADKRTVEPRRVDVTLPVDRLLISSHFGLRADPFRAAHAMHRGIDVPGRFGAPVYATADGVVENAAYAGGYGNMIDVRHNNGLVTRYGHLSSILVDTNHAVRKGQIIGRVGSTGRSTGNHLHFEVRLHGQAVDPLPFLSSTIWVDVDAAHDGLAIPYGIPRISAYARTRTEPPEPGLNRLPGPEFALVPMLAESR